MMLLLNKDKAQSVRYPEPPKKSLCYIKDTPFSSYKHGVISAS